MLYNYSEKMQRREHMIYAKIKRIDEAYVGPNAKRCAEVIKLICKSEPSVKAHVDAILEKKNERAAAASLCAFECLLELCAEHGIAPTAVSIAKTELGRPYFSSHPHVDFNVSHTDLYVAVALATSEGERVGIDVEDASRFIERSDTALTKIAKRFFAKKELAELEKSDAPNEKFIELWTRKEAYLKYTGDGISKMSSTDTLSALPYGVSFITDSVGVVAADTHFTLCYSPSTSNPNINCQT